MKIKIDDCYYELIKELLLSQESKILDVKKDEQGKILFNNIKADLIYTYFKVGKNFKVYPYTKIDNSILNNYQTYYNKYKSVLNRYTDIVEVK